MGEDQEPAAESSFSTRRAALGMTAAMTAGLLAEKALSPDSAHAEGVTSVNGKMGVVVLTASNVEAVPTSEVGKPKGVAELNSEGRLVEGELPSSVVGSSADPTAAGQIPSAVGTTSNAVAWIGAGLTGTLVATDHGVTTALSDIASALHTLLETAASEGKKVYLPAGTYTLATNLAIPANTHLYGDGPQTIIKLAAKFPVEHPISNASSSGWENVYLHDFVIDGNSAEQEGNQSVNGSPDVLMYLSSASGTPGSNIVVERLIARNSYRLGIVLQNIQGGAVRDCAVENNGRDGITLFNACKRIVIRGNRVKSCNDDHIALDSETGLCEDIIVQGNILTGPGGRKKGKGIRILGGRNISVTGNVIDAVCEIGIYVADCEEQAASFISVVGNAVRSTGTEGEAGNSKVGILVESGHGAYHLSHYSGISDVVVADNTVSSAGGTGISLVNAHAGTEELTRIRVKGNIVSSSGEEGIRVNPAVASVQIEDNTVYNSVGNGIYVSEAIRVKVTGNTVYNNGSGAVAETNYGIKIVKAEVVMFSGNFAYDSRLTTSRTQEVGVCILSSTAQAYVGENLSYNNFLTNYSYNSVPEMKEGLYGKPPVAQASEIPLPGAFKKGTAGFETEAEVREIREKLAAVISALKGIGVCK
jgi:parallel beta-helix repeat protein